MADAVAAVAAVASVVTFGAAVLGCPDVHASAPNTTVVATSAIRASLTIVLPL